MTIEITWFYHEPSINLQHGGSHHCHTRPILLHLFFHVQNFPLFYPANLYVYLGSLFYESDQDDVG